MVAAMDDRTTGWVLTTTDGDWSCVPGWVLTTTDGDWSCVPAPLVDERAGISVYPGVTVGNEAVEAELRHRISVLEALLEQERQNNAVLLTRIAGLEDDCNRYVELLWDDTILPYPDNPLTKERKAREE